MDDSPDPQDNLSIETTHSQESSASQEFTKPTEAMATDNGATVYLGPAILDQEHTEATKEESSNPQSASTQRRSSERPKACLRFLTPAELDKLKVVSRTERHVSVPTLSDRVQSLHVTKESESTADTSDVNDDAVSEKTPKIGFKHDPNEENALAKVELDNAPSGFEPFYADAPITPAEFEENKKIYDPALPILDRIDEGIKRFLYKRRLEPYRRKVFLKYLQYGGVSVGPNHSQGVTPSELKDMTKEEAMQARCTTAIFPKRGKPYPISFNNVATGYLTGYYMGYYNPDTEEEIKTCTDTMKNFFSYLLYHDVCPEQAEDLEEARKSCDRAAKELWMNHQIVHHSGPGDFNRGCSMLFGGYYFEDVDDPDAWTNVRHADQKAFTSDMARKVVKYGIAIAGNDRTARKFKILADMDLIEAKQVEDIDGFEVISVEEPTEETTAYYRELGPDLMLVGKVRAKEFRDPARGKFDLAPWEKVDWDAGFAPAYEFEFLLEADFFVHILPGMKFITTVYQTNFGQYYFDEILSVLPTFYKFLYNDWMMDYVEPEPINFIPDPEEVARRRARDSIIEPPEPTPAEWAVHTLAHDLDFRVTADSHPLKAIWEVIHALQCFGWDVEEIKTMLDLPEDPFPERGTPPMRQGEPRPFRLSNEPRNEPFENRLQRAKRIIELFKNPERTKPVIPQEVISWALKERIKWIKIAKGEHQKALDGSKERAERELAKREAQAAKEQQLEGDPSEGPTETWKEDIEKNEEIKGELQGEGRD
ncbi:Argonaute complex subunit Arb1 [Penicillium cf. griseofulvum]|nr:Argonaute complex subunit Arb1 [Penicillium cf. griseofulvum]